jgi:arginyl-tRNA synthetase
MQKLEETLADIAQTMTDEKVTVTLSRPEPQFGDYATNIALQLAGKLGRNPREIAEEIAAKLRETGGFAEVTVAGPGFINLRLSDGRLFALTEAVASKYREGQTVVIETNNPNPFKAMHIGHAFNAIIADSLANLIESSGAHTYRVSYHGDVGAHVGKSMWALLRYVEGDAGKLNEVPERERNSFMSRMYAEGARAYKEDEAAKAEIDELAKQSFTRENPLYAAVYETIFNWSFEQIAATVARLGNKPVERRFLESDADVRGVKIVRDNVPGVFQESDGALIFKGSEHGSFDNVFVNRNGQGLYAARDLGLIQLKNEQYHPDKSYIVTAEEQKDYFKGVLAAARLAMPELKDVTVNIPTGTVKLTTGKMSSRDGDVVEIGWLFEQIAEAIRARGGEATDDIVAGALRYAFLKVRIGGDVVFDINESVSIQGNSGPYLQYAHARACSILEKAEGVGPLEGDVVFDDYERSLVRKLGEYIEVVEKATEELLPHSICTYLYELAQEFNRFYEKCRIIGDDRERLRLSLVLRYKNTLENGLSLLGMVAPDKM